MHAVPHFRVWNVRAGKDSQIIHSHALISQMKNVMIEEMK